jgi:hypothetical protein
MSDKLDPWYDRSPRYLLTAEDNRKLRFASMQTRREATYAALKNLSESGLGFTVAVADAPQEGDMIKIEFTVPGIKQIACFATVSRVELGDSPDPEWGANSYAFVALEFRNLPAHAQDLIERGLKSKPKTDDETIDVAAVARTRKAGILLGLFLILALSVILIKWYIP